MKIRIHIILYNYIMEYIYVPMGYDCSPAAALINLNLRKMSLPFDWTQTTPEMIISCIEDDFANFHRNLQLINNGRRVMDSYGIQFPHEYPTTEDKSVGVYNNYPENRIVDNYRDYTNDVLIKYARRINRLRDFLKSDAPIIILMRSSYGSACTMKNYIDKKYNKNVIIILATKYIANDNPFIICCDPEYQSVWNDKTVWENAIIQGKMVYEKSLLSSDK